MTVNFDSKNGFMPITAEGDQLSDAELFARDHFRRFKDWYYLATPGSTAKMNLKKNDAAYDQFIPPELSAFIDRIASPFDLSFVKTPSGRVMVIMDADRAIELMEAANDY